jgi:hypothetical protein
MMVRARYYGMFASCKCSPEAAAFFHSASTATMVKKMRSSSGRVKMTVMSASGVTQTSIATLTRICKDRIEAEQRFLEEAGMFFPLLSVPFVDGTLEKARRLQERLTEARLEVGDHSEDAADDTAWNYEVDEQLSGEQWTGDDCMDDYENMEDLPNCFSKYFTPGVHVYV